MDWGWLGSGRDGDEEEVDDGDGERKRIAARMERYTNNSANIIH